MLPEMREIIPKRELSKLLNLFGLKGKFPEKNQKLYQKELFDDE